MSPSLNFPIYRGDTFRQTFTFQTDGTPIDLVAAGWTSWASQWRAFEDAPTAVTFTVDTSLASTGKITISADPATTKLIASGTYDVQATRPGETRTWVRGDITYWKDVTNV